MKRLWWLLFLMFFASGCAAYNEAPNILTVQPQKVAVISNILRLQIKDNIATLDPALAQTIEERQLCKLIYNGLVRLDDKTLRPVQGVSEKWAVSPDGKQYIFTLYKKARFHNSLPIKASDVKFSWERAIYLNSPEKYIFSNIVGYLDFVSGRTHGLVGLKVIDDRTLEVDLVNPDQAFLHSITAPVAAVVDRYQVVNKAATFGKPGTYTNPAEPPNGSGEFKLYEWKAHNLITLGENFNYQAPKPPLKRIEFTLNNALDDAATDYSLGELDGISDITQSDIAANENLKGKLQTIPLAEICYLRINPQIITDARVRQALLMAVDFRRIGLYLNNDNEQYLSGDITGYLASGNSTNAKTTVAYDTYTAAQLLSASGYPGGTGLSFQLYYPDEPVLKKAAFLLKGQWSARGINVQPTPVTIQQLGLLKANHTAVVYLDKWSAPAPDLKAFYYPQFHSAFGNGISLDIDKMIDDTLATVDTAGQTAKFTAVENALEGQFIIQPLLKYNSSILTKPWVNDLTGNRLGLFTFDYCSVKKP